MSTPASVYRCVTCGHGRNLMAWAPANVYGPLGPDGELAEDTDVWTDGIHEGSIQCREHPDGPYEKQVDGVWCRFWQCPECKGTGRVHVGEHWKAPDGYACSAETFKASNAHGIWFVHEGWFPVDDVARATSEAKIE